MPQEVIRDENQLFSEEGNRPRIKRPLSRFGGENSEGSPIKWGRKGPDDRLSELSEGKYSNKSLGDVDRKLKRFMSKGSDIAGKVSSFGGSSLISAAAKKVYFAEMVFIIPILLTADILDYFTLTGAGLLISWVVNMSALALVTFYLIFKGMKLTWNIIAGLLEFVPIINLLPIRTVTMIITAIVSGTTAGKLVSGAIGKYKLAQKGINKVKSLRKN